MSRTRTYQLTAGALLVVVVAVALYLRSRGPATHRTADTKGMDDPLHRGLDVLEKGTDPPSCRVALQHFNTHFTQNRDSQAQPLSDAQQKRLREEMGLTEAELAEVTSARFTPLDAHYLHFCFLLRDGVKALELRDDGRRRATPEKEAEAALAWVCAQIRLEYPVPPPGMRGVLPDKLDDQLDPHFVLLRGHGKPTARAIVFLGLLQQLGIESCILAVPGKGGEPPIYWACAVLGSDDRLYLFDTRMGMPLPSVDGGIATLGDLLRKDSRVLKLLDFGPEQRYDITAEHAAASEAHLLPQLGALAPRMHPLQEALSSSVRVAPDLWGSEKRIAAACRAAGLAKPAVRFAPRAARMQRDFYPESEGGTDNSERASLRPAAIDYLSYVHLDRLVKAMPREEGIQPDEIDKLFDQPRKMIFDIFTGQFRAFVMNRGEPRDLVLRGRYLDAARKLDREEQILLDALRSKDVLATTEAIVNWFHYSERVLGRAAGDPAKTREAIYDVLSKHENTIGALAIGTAAQSRLPQVGHLHALVTHLQAERQQFHLDNSTADSRHEEQSDVERRWLEARDAWKSFLNDYRGAPETRGATIQLARVLETRSRLLAEKATLAAGAERTKLEEEAKGVREEARRQWSNLARDAKDLQALGARYRAELLARTSAAGQ